MAINGSSLLKACPIRNMLTEKKRNSNGISHGLVEVGYDIRIKQKIEFKSYLFGLIKYIKVTDMVDGVKQKPVYHWGERFVLASTIEYFNMPKNLYANLHDKSSWIRKGVSVFNTIIEPGWKGYLTLEIAFLSNKSVTIEAGSGIGQVIFDRIERPATYKGSYQYQANKPVPSAIK